MKKIVVLFNITILMAVSVAVAQVNGTNRAFTKKEFPGEKELLKKAISDLSKGDRLFKIGQYRQALQYYEPAYEFNPDNALMNYHMGICHLYHRDTSSASRFIEKAIRLDANVDDAKDFFLARAYHLERNWDKAIENYKKALKTVPEKKKILKAQAKQHLKECEVGKELDANPVEVEIKNLGPNINTKDPEYCPLITADESMLVFTSRRPGTTGEKKDSKISDHFEDIYMSTFTGANTWKPAENMGEPINSSNHDATVGISPDGQKLLIYRGNGDIYESDLVGVSWSEPVSLGKKINSPKYKESHASFAGDGLTIYFVSYDRPDGFGGADIYKAHKDSADGEWGDPVNLGSTINTPYDDKAVFMHPDGKTMYFSSKGHKTMGGFDIFSSVYDSKTKTWSEPKNLGSPVNSPGDDLYFVLDARGTDGFYSSSRIDGLGEKDIYGLTFPIDSSKLVLLLTGGIFEADDSLMKPIGATIDVYDCKTRKLLQTHNSNSATGKYLLVLPAGADYCLKIKAKGYFEKEITKSVADGTFGAKDSMDIFLDRKAETTQISGCLTGQDQDGNPVGLPNATIEIKDKYGNVIKTVRTDENGCYITEVPAGGEYELTATHPNHFFKSQSFSTTDNDFELQLGYIDMQRIRSGEGIVLKNIFFDFGKSTLKPISFVELDKVVKLMNEVPSLNVELAGHTDNKGSYDGNQRLSESRAKSVYEYIANAGISRSRMEYRGYSYSQPVVLGKDTSINGYQLRRGKLDGNYINTLGDKNKEEIVDQLNRRTEFNVTGVKVDNKVYPPLPSLPDVGSSTSSQGVAFVNPGKVKGRAKKGNIPAQFQFADFNGDDKIKAKEINEAIDKFFEGELPTTTVADIVGLIDFFFEQ